MQTVLGYYYFRTVTWEQLLGNTVTRAQIFGDSYLVKGTWRQILETSLEKVTSKQLLDNSYSNRKSGLMYYVVN